MLTIYLLLQIIFLILLVISKINITGILTINIIKFLPILLNLLFSFTKKIDIKLRLGLLFTAIADYFFLFMNRCTLGISFFVLVQIIYYLYINQSNKKTLIILAILNVMLVSIIKLNLLIIETIIYSLLSFINILKSYKLSKIDKNMELLKYSFVFLLFCDLLIGIKYIANFGNNLETFLDLTEWIFYLISQMVLIIYALKLSDAFLYRVLQPIFTIIFKTYYKPTIVNKEFIPKDGRCVIAGNHKHALDPILVDVCTKRVVHTLAKKDLHDGKFGCFFKAIGTIPVDLKAKNNKEALNKAIEYLNEDYLINLSPEGKRNYTNEILLPFKYGAVVMAKKTKSKIVPYCITGNYKFRSKNLKIVFGKPLDIAKLSVTDANELLYNRVKKLLLTNRK